MEQQLIDLQTKVAFQDEAIDSLNRSVARQQRRIEELEEELRQLKRQLRSLSDPGIASPQEEGPPPHY